MYVFRLEAQTLVKEQSIFKISFLYCLATITFIPLYLFVVIINTYYDGSVTVTWSVNVYQWFRITVPCRRVKNIFDKYHQYDLDIIWKSYNFHLMLIATLSYSKFEII